MNLRERMNQYEDEYGEFDRIPEAERLHPSRTLCAYLKVASLMKNPAKFEVCAEHDCVYLPTPDRLGPVSDADVLYLVRCGVHYSTEADCLADFC